MAPRTDTRRPTLKAPDSYHHGRLRAELLALGLQALETEGAELVSLRSLAERAGVSKTAPYRHFKDRDSFLGALADEGFRLLCEELERAWGEADAGADAGAASAASREAASRDGAAPASEAAGSGGADSADEPSLTPHETASLVARMGRAYMDFAVGHPALYRLMNSPLICGLPEGSMRWARRSLSLLGKALAAPGARAAAATAGEPGEGGRIQAKAGAAMDIDAVAASWGYIHGIVLLRIDGLFPKDLPEPDWNRLASTMPVLP